MGYCKFCRKHDVEVSQFDRYPDKTLIRNERRESLGICWECELQIKSTKAELLEACKHNNDAFHMYFVVREMINALPDEGEYNLNGIYHEINKLQRDNLLEKHKFRPKYASGFLKSRVGYVVVAAARMKQESTPKERKQAAMSIFLKSELNFSHEPLEKVQEKYGKWFEKIV